MPAILLALLLVLAPLAATAQSGPAADCGPPAAADDGWQVAAPEAVGLDPATLCAIGPRFKAWTEADVHAVLVIRHGKLVYERYFAGLDELVGQPIGAPSSLEVVNFTAATKHALRSVTKSITALILGIEIGKGKIAGVDRPVLAQLPGYADLRSPEKEQITLRDFLTMTQGLAWNQDPSEDSEEQMDSAPDPARYVLAKPVVAPPEAVYNYSSGSAMVIAALLRQATGQSLDTLARVDLFEPLGITDVEWIRCPSGEPEAAWGLRMRPRDLAKIGQLVLDRGVWRGKEVVPADWIAAATAPQIKGLGPFSYGYQFWLGRSLWHGREIGWAAGMGKGGQRLFIVPSLDLVAVLLAGLYDSPIRFAVPLILLNQYILPAVNAPQ